MKRRTILAGAGPIGAGAAVLGLPAPAISRNLRQLKMVTDWPAGSPGLQSSAERLAQRLGVASGGRINIEVFPGRQARSPVRDLRRGREPVSPIMYHSAEYYWEKKSPAFNFFAAVPFGFTANELFAWVSMAAVKSCGTSSAAKFNIKPFLCGNTGTQMAGWCTREIPSPEEFRGPALPDARASAARCSGGWAPSW